MFQKVLLRCFKFCDNGLHIKFYNILETKLRVYLIQIAFYVEKQCFNVDTDMGTYTEVC